MLPRKINTAIDSSFEPVETDIGEEEQGDKVILIISKSATIGSRFSIFSPGEASEHEKGTSHLN